MCFYVAFFVDDWCLNLIFGYVVIGYVKFIYDFAACVDDWCLNLMLGYIVVGYVKLV